MHKTLGQPIVLENVAGAGGALGTARVVNAAPDGYTIGIGNWGSHVAAGAIQSLRFDLLGDLTPVAPLPSEPLMIVAKKTMPATGLKELIQWLKANPDKASSGTSGVGGPSHIGGLLFQRETGTRFQLVPYRGAGPAMQDLVGGQVDMMISGASVTLPQIRNGSIKVFAIAARQRSSTAPDVPTVDEEGLPGFYVAVWHGMWAPKGTSPEIIAILNAAVRDALADSVVRKRFSDLALDIPPVDQQTPDALMALQKAEIAKWWPIIKAADIKGN
jgi:tripartite-type tricarboxylate transporter receptor subunit TctC